MHQKSDEYESSAAKRRLADMTSKVMRVNFNTVNFAFLRRITTQCHLPSLLEKLCAIPLLTLMLPAVAAPSSIPGKFEVKQNGGAAYSIPIEVPPGVADMEPGLALEYNTRARDGMLGVGWSLSGLPAISRCGRTTPQDGAKGGVTYNSDDRFCLDGRRLMVASGAYGAADSVYRTEIDTFAKITAVGAAAGGGPLSFEVKTKSGLTLQFGATSDSRLLVAGKTPDVVRTWAVNRISDAKGNAQTVVYLPADGGTLYPDRIDYTSNSAMSLQAMNSVAFAYEARSDKPSGYQGGYPYQIGKRLKTISTKTSGNVVAIYTLNYDDRRIRSISKCDVNGVCLPKTTFGLAGNGIPSELGIVPVTASEAGTPSAGLWRAFDVDGDGRTDIVHLTSLPGEYRVWRSNGNGSFSTSSATISAYTNLTDGTWLQLDVDGDGLADLVHLRDRNGNFAVWRSNGDGTFTVTTRQSVGDTDLQAGSWQVLDINGDGLADLVHITANSGDVRVWRSNGDGTFSISQFSSSPNDTNTTDGFWHVLDLNGDGLNDLVHMPWGQGRIFVWKSNGDGTFAINAFTDTGNDMNHSSGTWKRADINGDGLIDLVHITGGSGDVRVWMSKGDGTFAISSFVSQSDTGSIAGAWIALDLNGDGRTDLVHTLSNLTSSPFYYQWLSKGDGTFEVVGQPAGGLESCTRGCVSFVEGDFQGNGFPGFMRLDGGNTTVQTAWLLGATPADLITSISNGIGGDIYLTLNTLPAMLGTSYFKDLPSDASAMTVVPALAMVQSVSRNAGRAHARTEVQDDSLTTYAYGSARVERNGRGFVGFNWFQSRNEKTKLTKRTYFNQTFPYIGLPGMVGIGTGMGAGSASWNNINVTTTSYACLPSIDGVSCSVAPTGIYFPYAYQVKSVGRDLDGTALPINLTVATNPDNYGNLQTISDYILTPNGDSTDYSKVVTNTYFNDATTWVIGRLVKSVATTTGPTAPSPVTPGSGGLPSAPSPTLPPQLTAQILAPILQILLDDD